MLRLPFVVFLALFSIQFFFLLPFLPSFFLFLFLFALFSTFVSILFLFLNFIIFFFYAHLSVLWVCFLDFCFAVVCLCVVSHSCFSSDSFSFVFPFTLCCVPLLHLLLLLPLSSVPFLLYPQRPHPNVSAALTVEGCLFTGGGAAATVPSGRFGVCRGGTTGWCVRPPLGSEWRRSTVYRPQHQIARRIHLHFGPIESQPGHTTKLCGEFTLPIDVICPLLTQFDLIHHHRHCQVSDLRQTSTFSLRAITWWWSVTTSCTNLSPYGVTLPQEMACYNLHFCLLYLYV